MAIYCEFIVSSPLLEAVNGKRFAETEEGCLPVAGPCFWQFQGLRSTPFARLDTLQCKFLCDAAVSIFSYTGKAPVKPIVFSVGGQHKSPDDFLSSIAVVGAYLSDLELMDLVQKTLQYSDQSESGDLDDLDLFLMALQMRLMRTSLSIPISISQGRKKSPGSNNGDGVYTKMRGKNSCDNRSWMEME
ncbi:hypothetical protein Tco_0893378 [Tanacetum coccineum]|uniref:Uncharacterized protein n=1 Tax=Tanacetum coccineum TaxID=301880 RepID=A0ABQ5C8S6_9ASTR